MNLARDLRLLLIASAMLSAAALARGESPEGDGPPPRAGYPEFSGIYPHLAALSGSYSECGIGAVVPWADRLWYVSYVSHKSGSGVGLYEIGPDLSIRRCPESVVGTHAGRMIHRESNQLIIGPYLVDAAGRVRVFRELTQERVTAVMRHLTDPAHKVYVQAMEGNFYEADVDTLEVRRIADLVQELGIRGAAHFKGGYTAQGRVVVANNSYDQPDAVRGEGEGRLAEWDGTRWTIVHRTAFCDVTTAGGIFGAPAENSPLWAIGWDKRSVLLAVLTDGRWTTYRLPKGSQAYDQAWCTEWPRIRQLQPGQLMLDMHGLFYLMSPDFQAGRTAGLAPLCYHLRMTPDFCTWQGRLVLAGNETSSMGHRHRTGGQPQSNLWFGTPDDLRRWGKPAGWGGVWNDDAVKVGVPSEPFLIQGFTARTLHVWQRPAAGQDAATLTLEVDREGHGQWSRLTTVKVPAGGYAYHVLPDNLPGVWLRLSADRNCTATAQFVFGPREPATAEPSTPLSPCGRGVGGEGAAREDHEVIVGRPLASLPPAESPRPRIQGSLMPFANRLWFLSYVRAADGKAAPGGLYEIDQDMRFVKRSESVPGIFANRKMVEGLLSIGPHLISDDGRVRTLKGLEGEHLVASIRHTQPGKMFLLTVDGRLLEADLATLDVRPALDLAEKLGLKQAGLRFHGGHLQGKTLLVAASAPDGKSGCLAESNGDGWKIVDRAAYGEISNWGSMSETVAATGRDRASAILKTRTTSGTWKTFRLPRALPLSPRGRGVGGEGAAQASLTPLSLCGRGVGGEGAAQASHDIIVGRPPGDEWPRIREVQTERMLMDLDGLWYETTGLGYAWFVRPIAAHRSVVSDFTSWRGMLVLAGNDAEAPSGGNYMRGGENVGLWFGKTDDLWQFGPPAGEGGPWLDTPVDAGVPSDPYLMTDFERKEVELRHDQPSPVEFRLEVDVTGQARTWLPYATLTIAPGRATVHHFPDGFSAHWIRLTATRPCRATARFVYGGD